jgi:hypothetical protein
MKRLIAFSSVAHMGFVMLGIATLTTFGINAAIFGMVAHGLITGMLFFLAGSVQHNYGTRELSRLGGLLKQAPKMGWTAETGHLVLATLHTQDAVQTIDRIIDVFPSYQQQQVRIQLASTLQGIISQQLLPIIDGRSRVVATEVLIATPAIRNMIRDAKTHQLPTAMQTGHQYGMRTMDESLADLYRSGRISLDTALSRAVDQQVLRTLLEKQQ